MESASEEVGDFCLVPFTILFPPYCSTVMDFKLRSTRCKPNFVEIIVLGRVYISLDFIVLHVLMRTEQGCVLVKLMQAISSIIVVKFCKLFHFRCIARMKWIESIFVGRVISYTAHELDVATGVGI